MKGKIPNIFGVVMALVLALSLVLVAVPAAPTSADPGTLRWSDITIPNEVRFQLNDGSDVGPIALSPDGRVIFAASGNTSDVYDMLMRSTDGGYTWKEVMTKLDDVSATYFPANIVDIVVSPSWEDDDTVLVATAVDVYISGDRGVTFTTMSDPAAGWAGITSIDVTMDEDG
ncbi:MAG: hypothetical protein IBX36_05820, partial [Dehalococcoidia bacterium]|nr:hypothetical protein [Dehalococcoidia bacterium]